MKAHFCSKTGTRIEAPGVSKSIDERAGVPEIDPEPPSERPGQEGGVVVAELRETIATLGEASAVFENERDEARAEVAHRGDEIDALQRAMVEGADRLRQEHAAEIAKLRAQHATWATQIRAEHAAEIAKLKADHAAELEQLTAPEKPAEPSAAPDDRGRRRKN